MKTTNNFLGEKSKLIRAKMEVDFKRAHIDPSTLEMTEWGMGDYTDLTKSN